MAHLGRYAMAALVAACFVAPSALASPKPAAMSLLGRQQYQLAVLKHDQQVIRWFQVRGFRLTQSRRPPLNTAAYNYWFAIQQSRWVKRELNETTKLIRLKLMGNLRAWTCIHGYEGAWDDRDDPYWGGLQMDQEFMRTYGMDMIRKHRHIDGLGFANLWTPQEQIIVAQRAYVSGRGYYPWPNTARWCGLI
jgi:hypothetical protein